MGQGGCMSKHQETPVNGVKTPFSEVNKRINAFWEVHIQTKKFTKNVCVLKKDSKLFIYVIYYMFIYVYYISVIFVYSLFILFRVPDTTHYSYSIAVSNYSGRSLW
jgi:hypothetical protein